MGCNDSPRMALLHVPSCKQTALHERTALNYVPSPMHVCENSNPSSTNTREGVEYHCLGAGMRAKQILVVKAKVSCMPAGVL